MHHFFSVLIANRPTSTTSLGLCQGPCSYHLGGEVLVNAATRFRRNLISPKDARPQALESIPNRYLAGDIHLFAMERQLGQPGVLHGFNDSQVDKPAS